MEKSSGRNPRCLKRYMVRSRTFRRSRRSSRTAWLLASCFSWIAMRLSASRTRIVAPRSSSSALSMRTSRASISRSSSLGFCLGAASESAGTSRVRPSQRTNPLTDWCSDREPQKSRLQGAQCQPQRVPVRRGSLSAERLTLRGP